MIIPKHNLNLDAQVDQYTSTKKAFITELLNQRAIEE